MSTGAGGFDHCQICATKCLRWPARVRTTGSRCRASLPRIKAAVGLVDEARHIALSPSAFAMRSVGGEWTHPVSLLRHVGACFRFAKLARSSAGVDCGLADSVERLEHAFGGQYGIYEVVQEVVGEATIDRNGEKLMDPGQFSISCSARAGPSIPSPNRFFFGIST